MSFCLRFAFPRSLFTLEGEIDFTCCADNVNPLKARLSEFALSLTQQGCAVGTVKGFVATMSVSVLFWLSICVCLVNELAAM